MTPMVFHAIDFSASQVGSGLAISALVGTVVRFLSGALLDRGLRCSWPVRATTLLAVIADITLFHSSNYSSFVVGEILLGAAAGLYWPAIELSVPLSCGAIPSGRGYALVRSSDALGFGIGALLGTLAAAAGHLRLIYGVEAVCMVLLLVLVSIKPLTDQRTIQRKQSDQPLPEHRQIFSWLMPLLPVLAISIVATGILSVEQSALPIDLLRGALARPELTESVSGALIAFQLTLLVFLQWPIGRWLAERSVRFGLSLSLSCFSLASVLLGLSALTRHGAVLVVLALLPMALAQAAFLPTATEAVIEETPAEHRGLAMALFSQCFAISAVVAPLLGGKLLDQQGHGVLLWLLMALACVLMLPTAYRLRPRFDASGQAAIRLQNQTALSGSSKQSIDAVARDPSLFRS